MRLSFISSEQFLRRFDCRQLCGATRAAAAAFEDRKEKQFSNELQWVQYTMRKKL